MKQIVIFFAFTVLLISCQKDNNVTLLNNVEAFPRENVDIIVQGTTTNNGSISLSAEKIVIGNPGNQSFTVTINPGKITEVSYQLVSLNVSHANGGMHVVKDPGVNQIQYNYKESAYVTPNGNGGLSMLIQSGNISIESSISCIVDEMDGW